MMKMRIGGKGKVNLGDAGSVVLKQMETQSSYSRAGRSNRKQ